MSYTRLHWVESETPLSAQNMNNIEDGIEELQAQKVDKVSGKALSDNNYTDAEKTKLAGIADGAEVNVQSDWSQSNSSADDFIKNKPGNATTSIAGFMSAADKSKLDGIAAGAQVNPGVATTSENGLMSSSDKTKLNGIAAGAEVNLNDFTKFNIESGSATVLSPTTKNDTFSIIAGSNVTMTASGKQVTINAKDTTYSDVTTSAHGLMTAADKTKLNGIAAGAEVNIQSDWNQTNTSADDYIKNKPGDATTSVHGFMTAADKTKLNGIAAGAQVNPGAATTSAAGLMSAADKTKLNGIAAGAEVNQNAFSNVKVGSTTVAADGKTDTLELVAGSNVTLTPDATNDKVTIAATNTTYSVATTSANGLMSSTDKAKLDGCKKITISTSTPSGGSNGDVWIMYT